MKAALITLLLFLKTISIVYAQAEYIVEIDRLDSTFSKVGPKIDGIDRIYPGDRAFDKSTGTFFCVGLTDNVIDEKLYTINTADGSIIDSPIVNNLSRFQYSELTSTLYCLEQDNANNNKKFGSVNTTTGVFTPIGDTIPGSGLFSGDFGSIDVPNGIYTFLDPSYILYSIDVSTGSIIDSPLVSAILTGTDTNLIHFRYDNSTGVLYGLIQVQSTLVYYLTTIDRTTGALNVVSTIGTTYAVGGGSCTIDEAAQEYIILYSSSDVGGYAITTFDLATGDSVSNSLILAWNENDNLVSIMYDNEEDKLFSLHWETTSPIQLPSAVKSEMNKFNVSLYPNPTNGEFVLETDGNVLQVEIRNILGEMVFTGVPTNNKTWIDLSAMETGIYTVKVLTEEGNAVKQLIIK